MSETLTVPVVAPPVAVFETTMLHWPVVPVVKLPVCDLLIDSVVPGSTVMVSLPVLPVMPAPVTLTPLLRLAAAPDETFTLSVSVGYDPP